MAGAETKLSWWDREVDGEGRTIRADVRVAAVSVWRNICHRNQLVVTDPSRAVELMEAAVAQISRYLDRKNIRVFSRDIEGLVAHSFHRAVHRELTRRKRFLPLDESFNLRGCDSDENWRTQVQSRLELQEVSSLLSEKSRLVLALRYAGYMWSEVALLMGQSLTPLRAAFWRDVARVKRQIEKPAKPKTD